MKRIAAMRSLAKRIAGFIFGVLSVVAPGVQSWSKEGHIMTCRVAQKLLNHEASHTVANLLPDYVNGDLSALCTWPDQIRHWYKYQWTSTLHYIDTPDESCSFDYSRDCHKDMCVAGAVQNFTSQLSHYKDGSSDRRYNFTEALLFLSHFMGDIHQPLHVGFTSDEGGNTINLHWFRRKSNLHHGLWSDDVQAWKDCPGELSSCPNKYAAESINIACKWGYKDVSEGVTLADDYYTSRLPIVKRRIAQGGVRLAMTLNHVFSSQRDEL
ncbi:unnamed protein product [Victoria cruziana]